MEAQEENSVPELITDRPDMTESPNSVPNKSIQIETGIFYESFEENNFKEVTYGYNTTLIRYGLFENFELRLGVNFEEEHFSLNTQELNNIKSGFSPLLAGMKVEIVDENGILPQIGLLGHVYLPFIASKDFRTETTGVDFRFSFAHTISEKSSLAYNFGAEWIDDTTNASYIYTLVYGYNLTDKISLYAEVYGNFPESNNANHLWDAGITYLVKNNIQLDATVGKSFTKGQDILVSTGISFRLPN